MVAVELLKGDVCVEVCCSDADAECRSVRNDMYVI